MIVLALLCVFILVYTYFLYPILIALCARLWPLRVRKDPGYTPKVSAIIPVYNAKEFIADKLKSLLAQDYPADRFEIVLCSDCSDDGSDELLKQYEDAHPGRVKFVRSEKRSGKPTAINLMKREASGDVLLMTDIRQPLSPRCLRELVGAFADESVGVVGGNLVLEGGSGAGAYWKYEKWIRKSEAAFRSMVGVSGSIYAIRKRDLDDLPPDIILDDMWVPMRQRLQGKRVVFAPGAKAYDQAFEDDREFSRKTRTLAGNYQLFARLPKLLVPFANPSWFEFFSHKIMRLVCPWALLALLVVSITAVLAPADSTGQLGHYLTWALLAGQAAFYLLAIAGRVAGPFGGIARTFVVLNYAAVVGLWRFLRQGQRITW